MFIGHMLKPVASNGGDKESTACHMPVSGDIHLILVRKKGTNNVSQYITKVKPRKKYRTSRKYMNNSKTPVVKIWMENNR